MSDRLLFFEPKQGVEIKAVERRNAKPKEGAVLFCLEQKSATFLRVKHCLNETPHYVVLHRVVVCAVA